MKHTLRTVTQGLVVLVWLIGAPLSYAGDLMTKGPASISNLIVQEHFEGRWRLATELRKGRNYRFRYSVVNRTPPGLEEGSISIVDGHNTERLGTHKVNGKFDLYNIRVGLRFDVGLGSTRTCYGVSSLKSPYAYPVNRDQRLARGNKALFAYHEFTWRCKKANAFALLEAPPVKWISATVTAELDHPDSPVPLSPNQQSSLKWNIGQFCANHNQCTTRRCDTGLGSRNTHRCLADDGTGRIGEYCNHHNQCQPGLKCFPQDPTRPTWLACQR
ncbi:MAG: hypothetical protein ACQ9IQ_03460 [Nitrospirales bacterium]